MGRGCKRINMVKRSAGVTYEFREKMYCMMNRGMRKNWELTSSGEVVKFNGELFPY